MFSTRSWIVALWMQGCLIPDSLVDEYLDQDGDGAWNEEAEGGTDCDDTDELIGPHMPEVCDGVDNNCSGAIDDIETGGTDFFADRDGDGHTAGDARHACQPPDDDDGVRWSEVAPDDCDDQDPGRYPGAPEVCTDTTDRNCIEGIDGSEDRRPLWPDLDGDGHGAGTPIEGCSLLAGFATIDDDCNDDDPSIHPSAVDLPHDCIDSDCGNDPLEDELDADGDGVFIDPALLPAVQGCQPPAGAPIDCDDLDPTILPGAVDVCDDGVDSDCDGAAEYDCDGDGTFDAAHGGTDCDDSDPLISPLQTTDVCGDGIDRNCDGDPEADCDGDGHDRLDAGGDDCDDAEPAAWQTCDTCVDQDGDGTRGLCDVPDVDADCDDADPDIGAHAWDRLLDGIDQDCSGADLGSDPSEAILVTADGDDQANSGQCGDRIHPCATIDVATRLAGGRPIFVGAGTFGPFSTSTDVIGGFDANWVHDPANHTTFISLGLDEVLVTGGEQTIAGLSLEGSGSSLLRVQSTGIAVHEVSALGAAATNCIAVDLTAPQVFATALTARCSSLQDTIALTVSAESAILSDLALTAVGDDTHISIARALRVHADTLTLTGAELSASGGGTVLGADVTGDATLAQVRAHATNSSSIGITTAIRAEGITSIHSATIHASSGTGLHLLLSGPAQIDTTAIHVDDQAFSSVGVRLDGSAPTSMVLSSVHVLSTGFGSGDGIVADGPVHLDHSIIVAPTDSLQGPGPWTFGPSVVAPSSCGLRNGDCQAGGLPASVIVTEPMLDLVDGAPVDLLPGSPAIDAGTLPDLQPTVDLHGRPRPVSEWDIGPWEPAISPVFPP